MIIMPSSAYTFALLCSFAFPLVVAQAPGGKPGGPGGGGGGQNVHVSFGDVATCTAPPSGTCSDFTITEAHVLASLAGFTTHSGGILTTSSIDYYGDWWTTNVGTSMPVGADFCTAGAGKTQTSISKAYTGVSYTAGSGSYTLVSASTSANKIEDYCSAQGGSTPPLLGTKFDGSYSQAFTLTPSTKSRSDISNQVGFAVDGVIIFSPFTGIATVAAFDETLDTCVGHPANGLYHYHGFTPCLHGELGMQTGNSIPHSKIYGWAFDGFPIYGPYGYATGSDASSAIVRITGGYACTVNGAACTTIDQKKIKTNWAWARSNGLLDDCNGRWTKTPEFPDGMYVYVFNVQENGHPDFPGTPYCLQAGATGTVASATTSTGSSAGTTGTTGSTTGTADTASTMGTTGSTTSSTTGTTGPTATTSTTGTATTGVTAAAAANGLLGLSIGSTLGAFLFANPLSAFE